MVVEVWPHWVLWRELVYNFILIELNIYNLFSIYLLDNKY